MALAKSEIGLTICILATQYTYIMQPNDTMYYLHHKFMKLVFSSRVHLPYSH